EERLELGHHLLAALDHGWRQPRSRVSGEAGVELGLRAVALDDTFEGLQPGECLFDEAVAEAALFGLFRQHHQPLVEAERSVNRSARRRRRYRRGRGILPECAGSGLI